MSQFDKRSSRRHDPSSTVLEDEIVSSNAAVESTADVGNIDLTAAVMHGPEDAFHGMAAGTMSLAAQGIDVSPVMTSLALRRRAMLHADVASDTSAVDRVMTRSGSALPNALRSRMEASFQHMFGHVRVHTDAAAEQAAKDLNAHAFAVGSHIYFGSGTWKPGSTETDRLLAHELTHVVQHDEGRIHGSGVSSPTDPLEREAYANEERIVSQLSQIDSSPGPEPGNGWMDASLALGPVPSAVENARDGGGAAQEEAGHALNEQAASLGASAFGMGGMVLRDETTEAPGTGPKAHEVGDEVYAKAGDNARRGVVAEVREWQDGDGGVSAAPQDGWTYVVRFERSEGTTTGDFVSENMRAAEVQPVPEASIPEASGDELAEAQVCEPEEESSGPEAGGEEESAVETPAQSQPETANSTPAAPDSVELPALGPVAQPHLQTSSPISMGPVAPVVISSSIPEAPELNATHSRVVESLNTRLGEGQASFNTAASEVESLCLDSASTFGTSEAALRTEFVSTNTQSLQSLGTDVDGVLTETDAAFVSFDQSLDQSASLLTSSLTTQAQETERALLQSEADFPLVIQRAIEAHKILMEAEFGTVITDISTQATEEKAAAELAGRTYGGGPARADEVAGQIQKAKVKENYAVALRTFLDAVFEDLMAKGGMPADEWAQTLHAPALSAVWPGMHQHQELVDQKKSRDQARAREARATYGEMVSLERTSFNADLMSHQDQVCEQQDEATEQLNQSVAQVTEDNAAATEIVASGLDERQSEEREALASLAPDESTGVDASMWDLYVAKYEYRSNVEHQNVLAGMASYNESGMAGLETMFSDMTTSMDEHAQQEGQSVELQQSVFRQSVQQSATDQVVGLQTQASDVQAQHIETAATAQAQASEVLTGIEGAAATFLTTTVQPALEGYTASTRERMTSLLGKMEAALSGAAAAGAAKEKQDRQSRASKVWAAADYTWGTDEAKMMEGVSGTSPMQAYALCSEYQQQQGHSLAYIIQDETSGSLKESLLAWIFGDEVAAAKHAMDYGSESWFPDAGVLDPALRGVSDTGRAALNEDPEWQAKSADDSLNTWYREGDSENALASLADMSLTQDAAALEADAALLFQTMDTISGTDEAGAYALLERYGPEKSAELRAAYAEYSYDRQHGDGSFDALSAEAQQEKTDNTLTRDINGDFSAIDSAADNDRALALSQGNMGAARAAQLRQSASWSNDEKAALDAVSDANMYNGDDWLQGVQATENHAVFLQTMAEYDAGTNVTLADIQAGTTVEGRQTAVDGWDANEAATVNWIGDEFSGWNTAEDMLTDKLRTGEADAGDMLMFGADTMGTREAWVTDALNQVKAQSDYYVRLDMLVRMGGRAATYIADMFPGPRADATRGVDGMMARLPSYLADLDPAKAASLTSAIRNILICLNAEADGGQQFDWELLLGESLRRDKNAKDVYEMADQKFKNMLPESARTRAANSEDLQVWLTQTSATRQADITEQRERWQNGQRESAEGQVTSTDLMLAAHIIKLEQLYKLGENIHYDGATGFLFDHANAEQATLTEAWWASFEAQCARVDTANSFEEASQNALAAMLTMIVTAVAGVAIAIVSFGTATAASAALISAGITLAAGLVNIAINFAVKGDRYGMEDMLTDLANTITDAAMQFATLGLSKLARVGPWLKAASAADDVFLKLAAAAVTSLPGELKGLLFNEDVWRGDNLDMALRQFFVGVAKGSVTGVTADYAKDGFKNVTQSRGLAGMYLEGAIDEITALAGDAVTNPAALQDPVYWINMTTKLGFGTLGGSIAQSRAVELMNGRPFSELSPEHLDRLHASALGELSQEHRSQIAVRALAGDEQFVELQSRLVAAARATTAEAPPAQDPPASETSTVPPTSSTDADGEDLPELDYTPLDQESDPTQTPRNQSRIDDDDAPLHVEETEASDLTTTIDPTSSLHEVPGTSAVASAPKTTAEIEAAVTEGINTYGANGTRAQMMTDHVMSLETPEARLEAINALQRGFEIQTSMHVTEMGPSDMDALIRSHMIHDDAFQEWQVMRKVVPESDMNYLWSGSDPAGWGQTMGGSVGPSGNTDGLTAEQTVSALGLDYRRRGFDDADPEGRSPYVTQVNGEYEAVGSLLYMDAPITDEMRAAAKIPVDDLIRRYAESHADDEIRAFALARYTEGQPTQDPPIAGFQEDYNPFTANGMTLPTSYMNNATVVPNQEYTMDRMQVAPGTQWFGLDSDGNRIVVLTYNGPPEMAHAPYTLNENIPPGSELEAQVHRILLRAEESTGQNPLGSYNR